MNEKASKPYSKLHVAWNYLLYYMHAKTKINVHSPFAYDFVSNVVDKAYAFSSRRIEKQRRRLVRSKDTIDFIDYGKNGSSLRKNISEIAKGALKPKKYAKLLGQTVKHYKPSHVLEIGTSLGITTSYLAYKNTSVTTVEGDPTIVTYAEDVWANLKIKTIHSIVGNFEATLDDLDDTQYGIIYIDGNHKLEPTLRYFNFLKTKAHKKTILIFDDIHYSQDMETAWKRIRASYEVRVTIDLFFLGIVCCDSALTKQDYTIRY